MVNIPNGYRSAGECSGLREDFPRGARAQPFTCLKLKINWVGRGPGRLQWEGKRGPDRAETEFGAPLLP